MESGHCFFLTSQAHALSSEFSSSSVETANQLISASGSSGVDLFAKDCALGPSASVAPGTSMLAASL